MKVLVTGAGGFLGRNLSVVLERRPGLEVLPVDVDDTPQALEGALGAADVIVHLAGVNRPADPGEFQTVNAGLTAAICRRLASLGRRPTFILSSSIQAGQDSPYGVSKRAAEDAVREYCAATGARGVAFRLKNLFGKWCRPNYNSVTATFCHNIARDLPIVISDPENIVDLTYVDDVVATWVGEIESGRHDAGFSLADPLPSHRITLGELAGLIRSFRESRQSLRVPDVSSPFVRALYATYLSYLPIDAFAYPLTIRSDDRGELAEFVKAQASGQIFISRTRPGITRGNHYHHTKAEKFFVVDGTAIIRFRHIVSGDTAEYRVDGRELRVVDIPPGYTHAIENVGSGDLITLFWASEVFDPGRPDTNALPVLVERETS
jgi:UDP-2-acetamido-2,6-beta-L-arabino-hexul-4-ose reductase